MSKPLSDKEIREAIAHGALECPCCEKKLRLCVNDVIADAREIRIVAELLGCGAFLLKDTEESEEFMRKSRHTYDADGIRARLKENR